MPFAVETFEQERTKMKPVDKLEKVLRKQFGAEAGEVVEAIVEYVDSVVVPTASDQRIRELMQEELNAGALASQPATEPPNHPPPEPVLHQASVAMQAQNTGEVQGINPIPNQADKPKE